MSDSNLTETEDYDKSAVPTAHKTSHQDTGSDEISVAGLSGELADNQPPKAHDLAGADHNADTLVDLNTKITDATLDDSADPRTPSAHKTSHQDGGYDEISVSGLSGVLSDKQDANKIQGFNVDAAQAVDDGKALTYDHAGSKYEHTTPSGVTDHGELTGLADDDHTQYHNDARGDARYVKITNILSNMKFADMYRSIIQGTWIYWNAPDQAYQLVFFNSSQALNDELDFDIFAENGIKVLQLLHVTTTTGAIVSVYLDDVLQGTIDFYTATGLYNQTYYFALNVVGTGKHSLRLKATSKHPSSSAYTMYLTHLRIK